MFAVLHIADFPLHAVLRSGAFDPGGPAALFDGNGKKSLVTAANAAARATGVVPGLTAPQAVARCAGLAIHAPRPAAEAEARALLLATALNLAPVVEATAPGAATAGLRRWASVRLIWVASFSTVSTTRSRRCRRVSPVFGSISATISFSAP